MVGLKSLNAAAAISSKTIMHIIIVRPRDACLPSESLTSVRHISLATRHMGKYGGIQKAGNRHA